MGQATQFPCIPDPFNQPVTQAHVSFILIKDKWFFWHVWIYRHLSQHNPFSLSSHPNLDHIGTCGLFLQVCHVKSTNQHCVSVTLQSEATETSHHDSCLQRASEFCRWRIVQWIWKKASMLWRGGLNILDIILAVNALLRMKSIFVVVFVFFVFYRRD